MRITWILHEALPISMRTEYIYTLLNRHAFAAYDWSKKVF